MAGKLVIVAAAVAAVCGASALLAGAEPQEVAVETIPLAEGAETPEAELSSLAWHGDTLVLLPQYPHRFPGRDASGSLFAIERSAIEIFLDTGAAPALSRIDFEAEALAESIDGFEGFEAIAFHGDEVFLTVEAETEDETSGVLFRGRLEKSGAHLKVVLDPSDRVELPSQAGIDNLAYEALLVTEDRVFAFYEANGMCNAAPAVRTFTHDLEPLAPADVDRLEYRLTDATTLDAEGRFWATNYRWVGDDWEIGSCPITARFGAGPSHSQTRTVERLVELELKDGGVHWTGRAPIQLELMGGDQGRNWEGIARLPGRGFLVVTDEHPTSLLGFVPAP